jgi:hypothetical protein
VDCAARDVAGDVALSGDRVEVSGEDDRGARVAVEQDLSVVEEGLERDELTDERHEVGLLTALRWDVDELEGSGGEVWE